MYHTLFIVRTYIVTLDNNVVMMLMEITSLQAKQQDQLIISFQLHIIYNINQQIFILTKHAVLNLMILAFVSSIILWDQKIMAIVVVEQKLIKELVMKVCVTVCGSRANILSWCYSKTPPWVGYCCYQSQGAGVDN